METKDTKQRLDDLQELLQAGYLTENEFRVARINALRESGVDIVIHTRKPETKHAREEEEEEEPRGCGCLLAFLLALAIGIGVVFFVPDWPDRLGGAYVRTVREWFSARWSSVFAVFSDAPSGPIPDPVASNSVPLPAIVVIVSDDQVARPVSSSDASSFEPEFSSASAPEPALPSSGVSSPDPARPSVSPDAGPELSIASAPSVDSLDPLAGRVSLPSLDARIFALPDIEIANMGVSQNIMMEEPNDEPNITIVEIPSSVPFN
ncbi:MAG: hypothetical protein LBQ42_14660, partial [Synergistaceae bacterium]|nr:hypothetical protein [Synergistaceae bacterium]